MKSYRLYVAGAFVDTFPSIELAVAEVLRREVCEWEIRDGSETPIARAPKGSVANPYVAGDWTGPFSCSMVTACNTIAAWTYGNSCE